MHQRACRPAGVSVNAVVVVDDDDFVFVGAVLTAIIVDAGVAVIVVVVVVVVLCSVIGGNECGRLPGPQKIDPPAKITFTTCV